MRVPEKTLFKLCCCWSLGDYIPGESRKIKKGEKLKMQTQAEVADMVKGKVSEVDGGKFVVNGETYWFSKGGVEGAEVGDEVEFVPNRWTSKSGEVRVYANSHKTRSSGATGTSTLGFKRPYTPRSTTGRTEYREDPDRQKKIIRQNVLGHATTIVSNTITPAPAAKTATLPAFLNEVKRVAQELEEWVNRE